MTLIGAATPALGRPSRGGMRAWTSENSHVAVLCCTILHVPGVALQSLVTSCNMLHRGLRLPSLEPIKSESIRLHGHVGAASAQSAQQYPVRVVDSQ